MQLFACRMKLVIRAHSQDVAVIVKPVGRWVKEAEDVVNGYNLKLM